MKRWFALILLVLGFGVSSVRSQELPDAPKPQPNLATKQSPITYPFRATGSTLKDVVTFKDKQFSAVALFYVGSYAADMVSTKEVFDRCLTCREAGAFFTGTRDTGKLALAWGAVTVVNIVVAHEWKKHVHNRVLRDLWSVGMLYQAGNHIDATVDNSGIK